MTWRGEVGCEISKLTRLHCGHTNSHVTTPITGVCPELKDKKVNTGGEGANGSMVIGILVTGPFNVCNPVVNNSVNGLC